MADQSRMHRFEVGDQVSYRDESEFPPLQYEGVIKGFANDELTYLEVEITLVGDDKAKPETKVLTEDEVRRIG